MKNKIPDSFRIPLRALLWEYGIYKTTRQDEIIEAMFLLGYCKIEGDKAKTELIIRRIE